MIRPRKAGVAVEVFTAELAGSARDALDPAGHDGPEEFAGSHVKVPTVVEIGR